MKLFAELVSRLGTSTKTNDKLDALKDYFANADSKDKVWVIAIFSGRRPRRAVSASKLQEWCVELTGLPSWLFEESYHTVGDLAETIALLLLENESQGKSFPLHYYLEILIKIEKEDESVKKKFIVDAWSTMSYGERFVFNKLITGGFRIGVSQKLMVNALAKTISLNPSVIAHRISGNWDPVTISFSDLLSEQGISQDFSKPFPFYLAYALEENLDELGQPNEWIAEWKWDGIRGQVIKRSQQLFVWSRGEELVTEKFPEYAPLRNFLDDGTVMDGEIICLSNSQSDQIDFMPLPFGILQTRIGRKNISKKQLMEAPVGFIAYDMLEYEGSDMREKSLEERRTLLEKIIRSINQPFLRLSPLVEFNTWEELSKIRSHSREIGSEGIMLKRRNSAYQVGRKRGDWWKWKVDPLVIDAVMVYAQKGHGRRSNLYTDYTFAVKEGDKLVTFTKAYSGLTDKEFSEVDQFVKRNSLEKFGPVRTVKPELVFEIAFEGIAASSRHKSGIALRFPRINRWRKDKKPQEINTLEDLKKMLELYGK
ncbi:MAG: ATP-dependent DNA ligase [Bacteroidetes bacterium]|nr:MAG: ATP-dependent DNA ligase [Bacteroidota bacterium]